MWIERPGKIREFLAALHGLNNQVLFVRGARQVGKTSFIEKALEEAGKSPVVRINLSFKGAKRINGLEYFGREYFGAGDDADELLDNLSRTFGSPDDLTRPLIVFIDEADRHPPALEAVQTLSAYSRKLKFVFTGSNLENIALTNAATGRKRFFDLYPITFPDFLRAWGKKTELSCWGDMSFSDKTVSTHFHAALDDAFQVYLRLGGMPVILDAFLGGSARRRELPTLVADLVSSIEDNIKIVLGEKSKLYEYEDVLRTLGLASMETLKFSRLQVQHAGRSEAKKIVNKTVGARVAHKIRLFDAGTDLSKYILFDPGVLNYLLNGSELLDQKITAQHLAIQYETAVGCGIIASLNTRDDLLYWKSRRGAQVEYLLKSPRMAAFDVKSSRGDTRSLDSCAAYENDLDVIVKVSLEPLRLDRHHRAVVPNQNLSRQIPLIVMPHYLCGRTLELLDEV